MYLEDFRWTHKRFELLKLLIFMETITLDQMKDTPQNIPPLNALSDAWLAVKMNDTYHISTVGKTLAQALGLKDFEVDKVLPILCMGDIKHLYESLASIEATKGDKRNTTYWIYRCLIVPDVLWVATYNTAMNKGVVETPNTLGYGFPTTTFNGLNGHDGKKRFLEVIYNHYFKLFNL